MDFRGAHYTFAFSRQMSESVKALSRVRGVTLFMTLLSAFQALLSRYSDQDDISIGFPIAHRNKREIEGLIGLFVNTLILRTDMSGDLEFDELLKRIREDMLMAYAHQDLPFEQLVDALRPERNLTRSPLFQVMFNLQNAPLADSALDALALTPLQVKTRTSKFDLTLTVVDTREELVGIVEYRTALFDASTIEKIAGRFLNLVEFVGTNPSARLSSLPLLSDSERNQILVDWSSTPSAPAPDDCVHRLFEAQVERTPDAVALIFHGEHLTYRQLNERANSLGRYLRLLGVEAETPVGIYMERSVEMLVALLGILKAGGCYVPLDPAYPVGRIEFMLADSGASVVLTQSGLDLPLSGQPARVVCVDADRDLIEI
jgi:non-ribosomal peptide synthetase component F